MADNVFGLGKSEFGRHYIPKSRETWLKLEKKDDFQNTLCACHTIMIVFSKGALLKDTFDSVMLKHLIAALEPMFVTPPEILKNPPKDTLDFLQDFFKLYGPLFIVLDEIGAAFNDDTFDYFEQREKFMSFCSNIVGKWFPVKEVFFLLLGRGNFLNYVGLRPTTVHNISHSPHVFERIHLHLLRPEAISSILKNTFIDETKDQTVAQSLNLNEEKIQMASKILFNKTNGHPRTLIATLKSCRSFEDIEKYLPNISLEDPALFYNTLRLYKDQVSELFAKFEQGNPVDLTKTFSDSGEKELIYAIVASNAFISWEGTLNEAKLFTHPFVKHALDALFLPFKKYLESIESASCVSIDYPNAFEWLCLKRFQELFTKKQQPRLIHPLFFSSPIFGNCKEVYFPNETRLLPKISYQGSINSDLDSKTAHPDSWKKLMSLIDGLGDSLCFKFRSKSASCDAMLTTKAEFEQEKVKLTVGLAVKNFSTTQFTSSHYNDECSLFNRVFIRTEQPYRKNILMICCTNYDKTMFSLFNGRLFSAQKRKEYPNIDEIILLDLSTAHKRQKFFGIDDFLSNCLENVVSKKEVEFEQNDWMI